MRTDARGHALAALGRLYAEEPLARRDRHKARLDAETFDVLVIGGGATGTGVALDAAARGFSVALVERDDFSSGTSSRSSKMIHGGFRYMQTGDVALVRESLAERTILHRNAPHLTTVLPMLIPLFLKGGIVNPKLSRALGAALWSYQFAGAWRLGRRHRRLDRDEVAARAPALDPERIGAGYLFHDLAVDDSRLTFALAATAAEHGAAVINRAQCTGLQRDGELWRVALDVDGDTVEARTRVVVNATGVWAGTLPLSDAARPPPLVAAKGTHLVLRTDAVPHDVAVSLPIARDRRVVTLVRWGPFSYVGSTDRAASGEIDAPGVDEEDVDYILGGINPHLRRPLTVADLTGGWAGFRPLVAEGGKARTADLSRRHRITVDPQGVVSVTGGKLTTYRRMAEETVDRVAELIGARRACATRRLPLHACPRGAVRADASRLARRYGDRSERIAAMIALAPELSEPITPHGETIVAEAVWALGAEMAMSLTDALIRRTRVGTFDGRALLADAHRIGRRVMAWTDWSEHRQSHELDGLVRTLRRELGVLA
jgi:glycerol-3-phosphate dehydrogenase